MESFSRALQIDNFDTPKKSIVIDKNNINQSTNIENRSHSFLWLSIIVDFCSICIDFIDWAIAFTCNIRTPPPPGWGLTFSFYPWRLAKIAFTPEDFHKIWFYPEELGHPLKNFLKIKASPPKNFTLPLIPWFLNWGEGGGGCRYKMQEPIVPIWIKKYRNI